MYIEEKGTPKMAMNKTNLMNGFMPQKIITGVAMTFDGRLAIKRPNGDYVAFNPLSGEIENQSEFVMGEEMLSGMVYVMPTDKIEAGDIIVSNGSYVYVTDVTDGLTGVNLTTGVINDIVTEKHVLFGKNVYKKVVSMFNMVGGAEGAMNPMMMLALMGDNNKDNLLPMMLMSGMGGTDKGAMNPMMMMMLLDGKGDNDTMKTMLMMQMMQSGGFKF